MGTQQFADGNVVTEAGWHAMTDTEFIRVGPARDPDTRGRHTVELTFRQRTFVMLAFLVGLVATFVLGYAVHTQPAHAAPAVTVSLPTPAGVPPGHAWTDVYECSSSGCSDLQSP